ncbi:MAG: adenosylmethionine decarboxylase [Gammaproteobacteria bacterium]|nr:adenosylmethionine decarboxylase [Gammaproteobacteria bacterium]
MPSDAAAKQVLSIVIPKKTNHYRIVTDNPDNWHIVASRAFAQGDLLEPLETMSKNIDVSTVDYIDVILEETQEKKRVYTAISAVPGDAGCEPTMLEIPWCFMNHSCEPNAHDRWVDEAEKKPQFIGTQALRDIAEGEELTYDYALEQYTGKFECWCDAESCRGTILGFKGLDSKQQQLMLPQASPFVQEKHRRELILEQVDISPLGRHLLVDYWDCNPELLNDEAKLVQLLTKAADAAGATVVSTRSFKFKGQGVTAVAILEESHISIHTWPGSRYAGVDVYTCGKCDPLLAHNMLENALCAGRAEFVEFVRGKTDVQRSIAPLVNTKPLRTGLEEDGSWFFEGTVPGRRHCNINHGFCVTDIVLKGHSRFQEYLIFDNPVYERVLVLDGIVQLSTSDEYIYHEMLVHPPMFAHPKPQRILIVGGGDGGTLREVLQHDPEEVVMIDIDEQFVRDIAEHLPSLSAGAFEDPRLTLLFEDASKALQRYKNSFDVAIIDCNDGVGPSEILFEENFYTTVARALKDDGICSVQAGSMLDVELLQQTRQRMANHLGHTTGFRLTVPIYHCGEYVFFVASRSCDPTGPDITTLTELQSQRNIVTRHWSPIIHHASQALPPQSTLW